MSDCLPADLATRLRRYPLDRRRPCADRPGTPGKVARMHDRLRRGEHPHHPLDAPMEDDLVVRVPVHGRRRSKDGMPEGWRILLEAAYRAEGNPERHWGGEGERAKRPGWQRHGYKRGKKGVKYRRLKERPPAEPFPEDPKRSALFNERQRLLAEFKRRHGPADGEGEADDADLMCRPPA